MHVRRAILLFAIVLGLAALAASLSRPREERSAQPAVGESTSSTPTARPGRIGSAPETITFHAEREDTRRLETGTAATVQVAVDQPGQVSIPELGLTAAAEPVTPARFDVLAVNPGDYPVVFTPAAGDESRPAGTLEVTASEE